MSYKRSTPRRVLSALALTSSGLLGALWGCGSTEAPSGHGGAWPVTVETLCDAQARYRCGFSEACACPPAEERDDCVARATASCLRRAAPAGGGARLVTDRVEACMAVLDLEAVDCGELGADRLVSACGPVVRLTATLGAACEGDEMPCADGRASCLEGRCTLVAAEGERCEQRVDCQVGLVCVEGRCVTGPRGEGESCERSDQCAPRRRCLDGTCAPTAGLGEACSKATPCRGASLCQGGVCVAGDPRSCTEPGEREVCGAESVCGAPASTRCVTRGALGAPCTAESCAESLYCEPSTMRCTAPPGLGKPCGDGVVCAEGLACSMNTALCITPPGSGEACALGPGGPDRCAEGLACLAGTCGRVPTEGEPCAYGLRCAPGLGCAFEASEGRCRPLRDAGGACDSDSICKGDAYCDLGEGRCAPRVSDGQPCVYGGECQPGSTCVPSTGTHFVCAPLPSLGESCLFDCAAGLTCAIEHGEYQCFPQVCADL